MHVPLTDVCLVFTPQTLNGKQQFLYYMPWSDIHSITFQVIIALLLFTNSTIICDIRTSFRKTTFESLDVFSMFYSTSVLQFKNELWSWLQGRKFVISADGLREQKMVFYSSSVLHAINLLQHISNSHRLHLNTKPLVTRLKEKNGQSKKTTKLWKRAVQSKKIQHLLWSTVY